MSGIDDRRKGMEAKLHHDGELKFKVNNRRNKLLGLWLAEQFGLAGDEAQVASLPGQQDAYSLLLGCIKQGEHPVQVGGSISRFITHIQK